MWSLLRKREDECDRLRDLLEDSTAAPGAAASVEELLAALPVGQRAHIAACAECRDTANELVESRKILKHCVSQGKWERPWFTARVMAAIEARERILVLPVSPWSAIPRLASRMVWLSAILFFAAGTWLYERPVSAPANQPSVEASAGSLFETAPPPSTHDEVLVSLAVREK